MANFFNKEPETLNWINKFKKKCIFFDIGANNGNYSIYACSIHTKIKEIYAFEPSFLNTKILARNIFIDNLQKKINIIQLPLFNKRLKILNMSESSFVEGGAFNSFGVDYDSNGKIKNSQNSYRIVGTSIDFLHQIKILPIPDYIKIDVDGIEHLILMGAKKMLKNPKIKSILIELYPSQKTQYNLSFKILRESGFKLSEKYSVNHIFIR